MVTLGDAIDEPTNRLVRAASARLDETAPHGVVDLVPAFASIAVHYDPALVSGNVDEPPYDRLVRELRTRKIAVTSPDPFLVGGTERPNAVRVCIGAETTDAACNAALQTIAGVFEQYPHVHDFH